MHRPAKRWPVERYAELATGLSGRGTRSVVIAGPDEGGLADEILGLCPTVVNLAGRTTFADIVVLARRAGGKGSSGRRQAAPYFFRRSRVFRRSRPARARASSGSISSTVSKCSTARSWRRRRM